VGAEGAGLQWRNAKVGDGARQCMFAVMEQPREPVVSSFLHLVRLLTQPLDSFALLSCPLLPPSSSMITPVHGPERPG
jgi:hypothetical protein